LIVRTARASYVISTHLERDWGLNSGAVAFKGFFDVPEFGGGVEVAFALLIFTG